MAVRSKRLAFGATGTAGAQVLAYTVPAGETTIVRSLILYARVTGPTAATVLVTPSGGTQRVVGYFGGLADGQRVVLQEQWCLNPGDAVHIQANTLNGVNYYLSGAELEGVAD